MYTSLCVHMYLLNQNHNFKIKITVSKEKQNNCLFYGFLRHLNKSLLISSNFFFWYNNNFNFYSINSFSNFNK